MTAATVSHLAAWVGFLAFAVAATASIVHLLHVCMDTDAAASCRPERGQSPDRVVPVGGDLSEQDAA